MKSRTSKALAVILGLAVLTLGSSAVLAQKGPGGDMSRQRGFSRDRGAMMQHRGMGGGMGMGLPGMLKEQLELTDEQVAAMTELQMNAQREIIRLQADEQLARLELMQLVTADSPDMAAIDAKIDESARIKADIMKTRVHSMIEAKALLTPEQAEKLRGALMGMGREFMEPGGEPGRRGRRMGPGRAPAPDAE